MIVKTRSAPTTTRVVTVGQTTSDHYTAVQDFRFPAETLPLDTEARSGMFVLTMKGRSSVMQLIG
ncbi:hypothetical protein BaRGS_00032630, partial [Batillaria attramentaria]